MKVGFFGMNTRITKELNQHESRLLWHEHPHLFFHNQQYQQFDDQITLTASPQLLLELFLPQVVFANQNNLYHHTYIERIDVSSWCKITKIISPKILLTMILIQKKTNPFH